MLHRATDFDREMRNAYKMLVGKFEGKRAIGRPGRRWENNIRMDLDGSRRDGVAQSV
jgi:hypothetical protein